MRSRAGVGLINLFVGDTRAKTVRSCPSASTRPALAAQGATARTIVRKVKEEPGYDVEVDTLTGTYTDPGHVMAYDDDGVRQQFSLAFRARFFGLGARSTSPGSLPRLRMWTGWPPILSPPTVPPGRVGRHSRRRPRLRPRRDGLGS